MTTRESSPATSLLTARTAEACADAVATTARVAAEAIAGAGGPFSGVTPGPLGREVAAIDLDVPTTGMAAVLDEVRELYLRDAVYFHHPRYLAHLNCPVAVPAVAAEAMLTAVNSSLDTWDQSAGAMLIERRLVDWTAERVGLGPDADGIFTSGGTQSNLQALLLARDEALARHADRPRAEALEQLRVFASAAGHFSVQRAARLLGLSPDAVIVVHTDDAERLCVDALVSAVSKERRAGNLPCAVVATAGTTDFGSIDPLTEIADVALAHDLWMHVDAAYGCGLLVSRRRALLSGIERADSVTVDFHKSFFQPVSSSAVLVRDRATLRHVTIRADYLNPVEHADRRGIEDQVDKSLQTTRRFDALKLWFTLRAMGPDGVGELFDTVIDLAASTAGHLRLDPRFEVAVDPVLSTVVFRWVPSSPSGAGTVHDARVDAANTGAREAVFSAGEAVVASTKIHGRTWLKLTLLNPETTLTEVLEVVDLLGDHAERAFDAAPDLVATGREVA
ncbi:MULTISPECIES: pyridoxal phosphate-dependent decarboxylase family protein [unclassified Knoellia]|uniref:pyridoxal phosphate-dependent decarboxylase family protein n=1 Tax=Knoellia altitudinis TaxID=3404795 RepID=UPI00361863CD